MAFFVRLIKRLTWLLILGLIALAASYYYMQQQLGQALKLESDSQLFVIEKGQSAHAVLKNLHQQAIISELLVYKVALKLQPAMAHFKAGTYEINSQQSVKQAFALFASGKEKLFSISLVEGLRWRDWLAQLQNQQYLVFDQLSQQLIDALSSDLEGQSLEGWLLPDTYHFTRGTNAAVIVQMAYQAMRDYLSLQWQQRAVNLPYASPYEGLIMASIIEKETGLASERPRIAGVFVNRLQQNMRLQTDPTVIYGMGEDFDGDIKRKDLRTATPYNTYVIKGLPPTPIAMPGKLAIEAAFQPMLTDELYFVARGDGSHQFSVTLKEHNQAVKLYQLKAKSEK